MINVQLTLFYSTAVCRPGYFSRRKSHQVSSSGLEPCTTCSIGFYQPDYGKTYCHECPQNQITAARGSTSLNDCYKFVTIQDPCVNNPCLNGGRCTSGNESFSCECPDYYVGKNFVKRIAMIIAFYYVQRKVKNLLFVFLFLCLGSICEKLQDPCESLPCLNEGICSTINNGSDGSLLCSCNCKMGFTGRNCEVRVNFFFFVGNFIKFSRRE